MNHRMPGEFIGTIPAISDPNNYSEGEGRGKGGLGRGREKEEEGKTVEVGQKKKQNNVKPVQNYIFN